MTENFYIICDKVSGWLAAKSIKRLLPVLAEAAFYS